MKRKDVHIHVVVYTAPHGNSDAGQTRIVGVATTKKEAWEVAEIDWRDWHDDGIEGKEFTKEERSAYSLESFRLNIKVD